MAKVDTQTTRNKLQGYLDPGEELLHVAYGIRPPGIFGILLIALFTLGIGAVIAMQTASKHYLVGVTRTRLLLLRVGGFDFAPIECTKIALNQLTQVRANTGPIFVRLEFTNEARAWFIKFHRAVFSGNREGAIAIGQVLEAGRLAPAPWSPQALAAAVPAVGAQVFVRFADGGEYPAQVAGAQGSYYLCRFTNGSESWVETSFIRVTSPAPVAQLSPVTGSVGEMSSQAHALVGVAMGIASVLMSVVLMLHQAVFGDLSFDVLLSQLFSIRLLFNWAVGAAIAGGLAAILSAAVSTQNPATRGAIIGAITYPGKVLIAGAVFAILYGGSDIVDRSFGAVIRLVLQPSLVTLFIWTGYAVVGAVAASLIHKPSRSVAARPTAFPV
jgi:hypothetical protein